MHSGTCLCGSVTFEVVGNIPPASVCHCGQCRKQSGHVWASAFVPDSQFTFTNDAGLKWFAASETAKRGFCQDCGSFLFWKHVDEDTISFSMGSLASPTGLKLGRHIFVADKGDYYDITDDLPQKP